MITLDKNSPAIFGKYILGFFIFTITYVVIFVASQLFLQFQNRDSASFFLTPYFINFMSAILTVYCSVSAVERFLPSIKVKMICYAFFGIICLLWLPLIIGFILALLNLIDAPVQASVLWSKDTMPELLHTITAIIFAWKLTNEN